MMISAALSSNCFLACRQAVSICRMMLMSQSAMYIS